MTRIARSMLLILLIATLSTHREAAGQSAARTATDRVGVARNYFTDTRLVNQDGDSLRFYTDLLEGKIVVINVFFTSCSGVCPPMARNLEKIQDWLGDRLGREAHLISISVDPTMDTPPRLKEYAAMFHARSGWHFLTGEKSNVELVLAKLGQKVDAPEQHSNIMIIGNERTGLWKKAVGVASSDQLIRIVESVLNDTGEPAR